jgi:hypothetical protein
MIKMPRLRLLGVLLCYNDGDLLGESISYLLNQNHHIILWDHGSTDQTPSEIQRFSRELLEIKVIPRTFDFYKLYHAMSQNLIENYIDHYDWISWPDQDEFLEGPSRDKSYGEWLYEIADTPFNWILFRNFNYWWTNADDSHQISVQKRVRNYCLFPNCAPRIRAWRAKVTNIRKFNHNPLEGEPYPAFFNLRHYPMRSREQMNARLIRDRAGLRRGQLNQHYENMLAHPDRLDIRPDQLHLDDSKSELNDLLIFDWRTVYGSFCSNGS